MPMLAANGETIHYEQTGSGPAVAFIHTLGASTQMWKGQFAALKDKYCLIATDCRGHGRSSANGTATLADAAQDLGAVLDHLGVENCHIVGLGMGGAVALHFNARFAAKVRSIVLADFSAKPADGNADMVTARREAIAYISMQEFGSQYAAEHLMFTTPLDVQDEFAAAIAGVNPKLYIQMMEQVLREDFTPLLSAVKAPALVLVGENDMTVTQPMAKELADGIPRAALEVIPAAAHVSNIDNPGDFNEALRKFLDSQR